MPDLLVVVPSRGRPHNIARLIDAMNKTCRGNTQLVVGLDWDDPTRDQYPGFELIEGEEWHTIRPSAGHRVTVELTAGPRPGTVYEIRDGLRQVVGWMNALAMPRIGDCKYVGHIGDDNVPRTDGWDVRIMEALEKTPFAYANDLYGRPAPPNPSALCCHIFTRAEVVQALGFLGQPLFRHMYVDVAWMQWFEACGGTYLEDCIIEHMHYTNGKAAPDASYAASTGLIPHDLETYQRYCEDPEGLAADIERIRIGVLVSETEGARLLPPSPELIRQRNEKYNVPSTPAPAGWKPGDPLR